MTNCHPSKEVKQLAIKLYAENWGQEPHLVLFEHLDRTCELGDDNKQQYVNLAMHHLTPAPQGHLTE